MMVPHGSHANVVAADTFTTVEQWKLFWRQWSAKSATGQWTYAEQSSKRPNGRLHYRMCRDSSESAMLPVVGVELDAWSSTPFATVTH